MARELRFDVSALDRASQVFTRMGRAVERFERRLDELDGKTVDVDVDVDTNGAERKVGSFARETRARLEAALRNLPELEIDADSGPAERAVENVRRRLAELSDKTVGIDIGAAEALAETRELQRQLDQIGRTSPNVQVRADVGRASAQLAAINAQVDRLDGRDARIRVHVDRGLDEAILRVSQLGRTLGTVLPFAAAAASPPIASLGSSVVALSQSMYLIPAAGVAVGAGIATVAIGMQGFIDTLKNRGDIEAWAASIAELAPNARFAATAVKSLGDSWGDMQQLVQQNLFQGASNNILQLSNSYLPILRNGLSGIATELARAGAEWTRFMSSAQATSNVAASMDNVVRATAPLGGIVSNLSSVFFDLAAVGSNFLPGLANGLERATGQWAAFIAGARESGQLAQWIQEGIDTINQLGRIVGNVGASLGAVFRSAETAGADFLGTLERGTSAIRRWTESTKGGEAMVSFFQDVQGAVDALAPGLIELGTTLAEVIKTLNDAGTFTAAASALSALAEAASPTVEIIGELAAMVLPSLLAILESLAPVLGPVIAAMLALTGAGRLMAAAMTLPASAIRSWQAFRTFGQALQTTARGARSASGEMNNLGGRVGFLGGRTTSAVGAMRQFAGEMRLQRSLAAASGQQIGRLGSAWAALETSQLSATRTAAELRAGYVQTSSAVQNFANSVGRAADQASNALGTRLANAASRGVEGIIRIPGAVAGAANALQNRLGYAAIYARESLIALPRTVSSAASTLSTGLGVAAINAAEAVRRIPAAVQSAASTLSTGIGVAAINAGQQLQRLGTYASSAGQAMATGLRSGVTSAVAAVRQLPAATVAAGQAMANGLRNGVNAAAAAVQQLPARVVGAVRNTATQVAGAMRQIPTAIRTGFSSIGSAVSGAIGHLGRFSGAVAGLSRTVGSGLMRAAGSLTSFLGGPWGVALAVAGGALAIFGQQQADAAAKAREHQAALDAINGTLDQHSGAITQATVNEKARQLQQDGSLDMLNRLGVATNDYTQATLGNQQALDRVVPKLFELTQAGIEATPAFRGAGAELERAGITLDMLTRAAMGYAPAQDQINSAIDRTRAISPEAGSNLAILADQMMRGGGEAAILAQRLGLSVNEVQQMQDATQSAATAAQDFQAGLEGITPAMAGIQDGVMPTKELATGMNNLAQSAGTAAQRAGESAAALGGVDAGARAAASSMEESRNAFMQAAQSAGMTEAQAGALANQIGLIPAAAETNFRTNATGVAAEMNTLNAQINAVPAGKEVRVQAMTDEARGNLTALGFQVQQMPDGTFTVTGNTDQARASLDAFVAGAANREARVQVGAETAPANQALSMVLQAIQSGRGEVTIDGNSMPAQSALSFVMGAIGTAQGEVTINGNAVPAQSVLQSYIGAVNAGQGQVTINGNRIPADQVLQALIATANGGVGTIQIDGNPAPANGKIQAAVTTANGQTGTITIDGNQAPADGKIRGTVALANGSTGTVTIDGNDAPANGKIQATIQYADGSTGTVTVNANDAAARAAIAALQRPTFSTHTITVTEVRNIVQSRPVGALVRAQGAYTTPRAAGAYTSPGATAYASGGYRSMSAGRAEIVPPRHLRVIGDRMRGDEAFIPINDSPRSHSILRTTADKMGYTLLPKQMWSDMIRAQVVQTVQARAAAPQIVFRGGHDATQLRALMGKLEVFVRELAARGDVNINNHFAVAALGHAAEAVTRANRTAAALGLFAGGKRAR